MQRVEIIDNVEQKENIARTILEQLPEWFGLPDSTKEYIENSRECHFGHVLKKNSRLDLSH